MIREYHWRNLIKQLEDGQLALFIGADLPYEVTGVPSRTDLARDLAQHQGLDESWSLAKITQQMAGRNQRYEFTAFIRDALNANSKPPQIIQRRIAELVKIYQIKTLITTVYDNRLESAFQQKKMAFHRLVRDNDVPFITPDRPTLIKLYGDINQVDTLVVTKQDHNRLYRDRDKEDLLATVGNTLRHNTILMLGYDLNDDLNDDGITALFDQVAESRFARKAYAIVPNLPEEEVLTWQDRGIIILQIDPLDVLDKLLGQTPASAHIELRPPIDERINFKPNLDDEKLIIHCFDHFPSVYNKLNRRMSHQTKMRELLKHYQPTGQFNDLAKLN